MAPKRSSDAAERKGKRSRTVNFVPIVVEAIAEAEVLPEDLRQVLAVGLPLAFGANKVDRHAFETELVTEAEKAMSLVEEALAKIHADALEKQSEVISPDEHAKRTAAKKKAEAHLETIRSQQTAKGEVQATAKEAVKSAKASLKAAEKEASQSEKEMQALVDNKTNLSELLANEFVQLKEGTSNSPEGKKAVKKFESIGKAYSIDETLLQTLPLTCKKEPESRTEFEAMMFTSLHAAIDKQIQGIAQKLTDLEPTKADAVGAVASAKDTLSRAEAELEKANQDAHTSHTASKEAAKEVAKAEDDLYNVWGDMKKACDAQDEASQKLKHFKDEIVTAFTQLKEKEEKVEEEPVAEEPAGEPAAEEPVAEEASEAL